MAMLISAIPLKMRVIRVKKVKPAYLEQESPIICKAREGLAQVNAALYGLARDDTMLQAWPMLDPKLRPLPDEGCMALNILLPPKSII